MKLNFNYCKKCDVKYKFFSNHFKSFIFYCENYGFLYFDKINYKAEKFNVHIFFDQVSKEEWIDINKTNIICCDKNRFLKDCIYGLEHIVDQQK